MVYYRKYRPQNLDQLIGQDNIKQTLLKAFQEDRLAHAYLFYGPKGTGKTSTARILAKMVNCEQQLSVVSRQSSEKSESRELKAESSIPCNECASCLSITDGSNLDFIEIDAASNRGIDDIRALRENIKLAPSSAKKKVYVIDEVHMLTTEAFNALLKTLEEPPSHVLFILATTEDRKIPATILSRVQKLDFQFATQPDLIKALQNVVGQEKLEVEDEALALIAKRGDGSFRDSLKILDMLSSKGQKITAQDVEASVLSGSREDVLGLILAIASKDVNLALEIVHSQVEKGVNLKEFINEMLGALQEILISLHSSSKTKPTQALSEKMSLSEVLWLIKSLHRALEMMKTSSIQVLPLEVVVVEASQSTVYSLPSTAKQEPIKQSKPITLSTETIQKLEEAKQENSPEIAEISTVIVGDSEQLAKLLDKWNYILETVKPYNYSLEALLRQVKVKSCDDGVVLLEVPYTFHQRILEAPKSRDLLESVVAEVLGKAVSVKCVLGARPVRVEELANVELAADDEIIRVAAEIFNSEPIS